MEIVRRGGFKRPIALGFSVKLLTVGGRVASEGESEGGRGFGVCGIEGCAVIWMAVEGANRVN